MKRESEKKSIIWKILRTLILHGNNVEKLFTQCKKKWYNNQGIYACGMNFLIFPEFSFLFHAYPALGGGGLE